MTLRLPRRLRLFLAATTLVPALGLFHPALADTQDIALTMVQRYDFGRNLRSIGLNVARGSRAYPAIAQALGARAGDVLVREKLVQFAPKYQEQWDANLAAAYSAVFTEAELRSFAEQGAASDRIAEFNAKRGDVGSIMRDRSQALLEAYVADALDSAARAARRSATPQAASVDGTPVAVLVGAAPRVLGTGPVSRSFAVR